jgi:hypothetical protein
MARRGPGAAGPVRGPPWRSVSGDPRRRKTPAGGSIATRACELAPPALRRAGRLSKLTVDPDRSPLGVSARDQAARAVLERPGAAPAALGRRLSVRVWVKTPAILVD